MIINNEGSKWAEALHVKLCKHFAVSVTSGPVAASLHGSTHLHSFLIVSKLIYHFNYKLYWAH